MKFWITIFSKETIFSKVTPKNNFWGAQLFFWEWDDKNEYNLSYGKWDTEYCFKIFSQKNPFGWMGAHFPRISGSIGPIVSKLKKTTK